MIQGAQLELAHSYHSSFLYLVDDIEIRYGAVYLSSAACVFQQIEDVGYGGGNPTTPLIEKLTLFAATPLSPCIRKSAMKAIARRYDWDRIAEETAEVFRQVATRSR